VNVLVVATGVDTGGQGDRIERAFANEPGWTVTARSHHRHPFGYPSSHRYLSLRDRTVEMKRLYDEADVVHLRNYLLGWQRGKPTVLHHHGTEFRTRHGVIARNAEAIGALQIASTLDLTLLEPGVEWVPSPYDVAELRAMKQPHDGPLRIAHFPTSAKVKSTDAFLAATARLAERHPIEVVTNVVRGRVRHMPWSEVMRQKATADIYFDQVTLGYGNNAIEAWGMGIPVVAGVADQAVREVMLDRFGHMPFVEATEQTIEQELERLITSPAMRAEYAELGTAHVQRFHDGAKVVPILKAIYSAAPPTNDVTLPRSAPAWLVKRQSERARRAAA
jgi:hypothetical protein